MVTRLFEKLTLGPGALRARRPCLRSRRGPDREAYDSVLPFRLRLLLARCQARREAVRRQGWSVRVVSRLNKVPPIKTFPLRAAPQFRHGMAEEVPVQRRCCALRLKLLRKWNCDNSPSGSESVSASQPQSAILIGPLRSCLATNTESDRDCDPDSDADTDSGSSTAIFLHVGAHRAHEKLFRRSVADTEPRCRNRN